MFDPYSYIPKQIKKKYRGNYFNSSQIISYLINVVIRSLSIAFIQTAAVFHLQTNAIQQI